MGDRQYFDIPLNDYVREILSDPSLQLRSFTLTPDAVSICYSKEVSEVVCNNVAGIDRNLHNLTVGNDKEIVHYDLSKTVEIVKNTRSVMRSFKRNDARIRKKIYAKYGRRRRNRVNQILHRISKQVAQTAKESQRALAFEDIRRIRQLYKRGNGQYKAYRGLMNSWSFAEIKRQIEYKAQWQGVPVIQLTTNETRRTSQLCPRCGKKMTRKDRRQLWCAECKRWIDRDVAAAMNLSIKGLASEAMRGNWRLR